MVGVATYSDRIHHVALGRNPQRLLGNEELGIPSDPRQPYTLTLNQVKARPDLFQIAAIEDGYALLVDNDLPLSPAIFAFDKDGQLIADSLNGERWLVADSGEHRPAAVEPSKQSVMSELRGALESGQPWTKLTVQPETAKDQVISPLSAARPVAAAVVGADQAEDATTVTAYIEHAAPGEPYYERDDLSYAVADIGGTVRIESSTRSAGTLQLLGTGTTVELRNNRDQTAKSIDLTGLLRSADSSAQQRSIGSVALSHDGQMVAAILNGNSPMLVVHDLEHDQRCWLTLAEGCRIGDLLFSEDGQRLFAILQTDWDAGSLDIYAIDRGPGKPTTIRLQAAIPGIKAIRRLGPTMLTQASISGVWSGLRENLYR